MLTKWTHFKTFDTDGQHLFEIRPNNTQLIKVAGNYHPEIYEYIRGAKPIEGKTQLLIDALGAGEAYGSNSNGDYFPEAGLKHKGADYGYETFMHWAYPYKHHMNKGMDGKFDQSLTYGDRVILSVYHPVIHRVQLIVSVDNNKAADIVYQVNNGEYPEVSMGAKLKYDQCSICGSKHTRIADYCDHLKYEMGRIYPDGRKVYAINPYPKFFDISFVLIGAEKCSRTLMKVAKNDLSAVAGHTRYPYALQKRALDKSGDIIKDVPSNLNDLRTEYSDLAHRVQSHDPEMRTETLNGIADYGKRFGTNGGLKRILSTLVLSGITPKPPEFQRIFLRLTGREKMADDLDRRGIIFDQAKPNVKILKRTIVIIDQKHFDDNIFEKICPSLPSRSSLLAYLLPRLNKHAAAIGELPRAEGERKPMGMFPIMAAIAAVYALLGKDIKNLQNKTGMEKLIGSKPWLLPIFAGLGITGVKMFSEAIKPHPQMIMPTSIDNQEQQNYNLMKAGGLSPAKAMLRAGLIGVPATYMLSGMRQLKHMTRPYEPEGKISKFVRKYPDYASIALVIGAGLSPRAIKKFKGTPAWAAAKKVLAKGGLIKKGSLASNIVDWGIIWPLVGVKNVPAAIASGMVDAVAFAGLERAFSKKKRKRRIS